MAKNTVRKKGISVLVRSLELDSKHFSLQYSMSLYQKSQSKKYANTWDLCWHDSSPHCKIRSESASKNFATYTMGARQTMRHLTQC